MNRTLPARAYGWLTAPAEDFVLARALFLRVLGLIYAIAFASFGVQARGLFGADGISPIAPFMDALRSQYGGTLSVFLKLPTVFWFGASDEALVGVAVVGAVLGLLVVAGLAPRWTLLACWFLYLSIVNAGSPFMDFQWDMLLLEAGLLAVLLAPGGPIPEWRRAAPPPRWALVLFWLLFFKLMLLSGAVKLLSGDPTWRNFTALEYHYWTQPLPTWVAWWADRVPHPLQRLSAALMFAIEIGVPFLIFAGRRGRRVAAVGLVGLQLLILVTGNYGFFNYLTASLALLLVDDAVWRRVIPARIASRLVRAPAADGRPVPAAARWRTHAGFALAAVLAVLSLNELVFGLYPGETPAFSTALSQATAPFRSVNGYGLFAVMTTTRPEIVIEGTRDGTTWAPYAFRWKPGALDRVPKFVAPYQPRLDWQLWFAALGRCMDARNRWFLAFQWRLLQADPAVLGMLGDDPFHGERPQRLRTTMWQYRFASPDERARTGAFWTRSDPRPYCPELMLDENGNLTRAGP